MTSLNQSKPSVRKNLLSFFVKLSVISAGAFLSGCALNPEVINSKQDDTKGTGTIVFSITHDNSGGFGDKLLVYLDDGAPFMGIGSGATFQSSERSGSLVIDLLGKTKNSDFKDAKGYLMITSLAAGEHTFANWQISDGAGLRVSPAKGTPPLKFIVKKGAVTYLGNFHGYIGRVENIFGMTATNNGLVAIKDERNRDLELLRERRPELNEKVEIELLKLGIWNQASGADTERRIETPYVAPFKK